jgi:hypothetical protein
MSDLTELITRLGTELGDLVKLYRDMDESCFDKIEHLSRNDAQAILAAAIIVLAERQIIP